MTAALASPGKDHSGSTSGWVRPQAARRKGGYLGVDARRRRLTVGVLLVLALVFALGNHPTVLTVLLMVVILLAVPAVLSRPAAGGRPGER
jgi:Flp pilus assembly protein TadB